MKRFVIGTVSALALMVLVTGCTDGQVGFGRLRTGRIAPAPPVVAASPVRRSPTRPVAGVPSMEFRLPPEHRSSPSYTYVPLYATGEQNRQSSRTDAPNVANGKPAAPSLAVTRRSPDVFYVVPGCYAGNRPPREGSLPTGCNITRLRTIG